MVLFTQQIFFNSLQLQYGQAPGEFLTFNLLPGISRLAVDWTFTLGGVRLVRASFFIDFSSPCKFIVHALNFHSWS